MLVVEVLPAAVHGGGLLLGRPSAVCQDAEGGSSFIWLQQERVGLGPLEEEDDEWVWRDEGQSQGTSCREQGLNSCWGVSMILVLLCCGFSGCTVAWDRVGPLRGRWQQVSSLLSSLRGNLLVCSFSGLFTLLVEDFGEYKKPSWEVGFMLDITPSPFRWALYQLLPFVCRGQGSAG